MEEKALLGGVANAGEVVRHGSTVVRPTNPHSASIHQALEALREHGFGGAPRPIGIDPDGRERLEFIEGDVPVPPYRVWAAKLQANSTSTSKTGRTNTAPTPISRRRRSLSAGDSGRIKEATRSAASNQGGAQTGFAAGGIEGSTTYRRRPGFRP